MKNLKSKKVAVAMSGGVDSSVCALLLKKKGFDVFGITMKTIPGSKCCKLQDINQAKKISKKLGIKHYIADLKEIFEKEVIDYFIDESLKGRNPNPCVSCNRKVKFGALIDKAKELGAELVATGHYAILEKENNIVLKRPVDIRKDQSYVLSMLPKKTFEDLIFPIGKYTKKEVRKIAKENKLHVHDKEETQDLCFLHIPKGEYIEEKTGKKKTGKIVNRKGEVLGTHKGHFHYTIGQRKGLNIKGHKKYYVYDTNPSKNLVIVSEKDDLYLDSFYVSDVNWVSIESPEKEFEAEVIIRNKMKPVKAKLIPEKNKIKVVPKNPVWAVSPGQIAVFINEDIVLGGGWIE